MREFDLDLLIGKEVVVNCKTEAEEIEFLTYLQKLGIKWCSGCAVSKNKEYRFEQYQQNTCFSLYYSKGLAYSDLDFYISEGYKILSLDDLVVKEKPRNNFKDYGFEADFEGEILRKTKHNIYIGYVVDGIDTEYAIEWNSKGDNLLSSRFDKNFNLKPIKKEWYEKEDTFRIAVRQIKSLNDFSPVFGQIQIMQKITDDKGISQYVTGEQHTPVEWLKCYQPATKEEVLSLLVKE